MRSIISVFLLLSSTLALAAPLGSPLGSYDTRLHHAVQAGQITAEQELIYGTWARFYPERIVEPTLRPLAGEVEELASGTELILRSASAQLPHLSIVAQKALIPFLVSPVSPESAIAALLRSQKKPALPIDNDNAADDYADDATPTPVPGPDLIPDVPLMILEDARFRVWYQKDYPAHEGAARRALDALNNVATRLMTLMDKKILDDSGKHPFVDLEGTEHVWGDGGNGKLDVYLFRAPGNLAVTLNYPPSCSETPSFIVVAPSALDTHQAARNVMTHEFMHVMQYAFKKSGDCLSYHRVDEGVAIWAANYIDPKVNFERGYNYFFPHGFTSFVHNHYDTWPFYLYLTKTFGDDMIRRIYQGNATRSAYDSIDNAIDGGFNKQWPEYTTAEWNQLPNHSDFREWDDFNDVPLEPSADNQSYVPIEKKKVTISDKGEYSDNFNFELAPTTRKYFHYVFDDTATRSIGLEAPISYEPSKKIRLRALVKRAGTSWVIEDWNDLGEDKEFCQDLPDSRLEELVLIFSNVEFTPDYDQSKIIKVRGRLKASNLACKGWKGRLTVTRNVDKPKEKKTLVATSTATFERDKDVKGHFSGRFLLKGGSGTYVFDGVRYEPNTTCTAHAEGTFTLDPKLGRGDSIGLYPHHVSPTSNARSYNASLYSSQVMPIPVTYHCIDGKSFSEAEYVLGWYTTKFYKANAAGHLVGKQVDMDATSEWDFAPL